MSSKGQLPPCPMCGAEDRLKNILPAFHGNDYGHVLCHNCGGTFDSNVTEIKNAFARGEADPKKIADDKLFKKFFVETSDIRGSRGDVYPRFEWDDNAEMQASIATEIGELIKTHMAERPSNILDLGCGNGFTTRGLARIFGEGALLGLDPSPTVMDLSAEPAIACLQGTLINAAFAESSFDVVVIIGNLMLHDDPSLTLKEVQRILKPGGVVIFDFKNIRSTARIAARLVANLLPGLSGNHLIQRNFVNMRYGMSRAHIEWLCPSQRFEIIETKSKPPRLLAFKNKSSYSTGIKGTIWALFDWLDKIRDERAWLQVVARKLT